MRRGKSTLQSKGNEREKIMIYGKNRAIQKIEKKTFVQGRQKFIHEVNSL